MKIKVGEFSTPGVTGNQSITGVGFQPVAVLFFTPWLTTTTDDSYQNHASECVGATDGTRQWACATAHRNGVSTSDTFRAFKSTACLIGLNPTNGATGNEASIVSLDADGFTLDWAFSLSGYRVFYMAIGDGTWHVGTKTALTTTGTDTITGLGFAPTGAMFASTAMTAGGTTNGAHLSIGLASSEGGITQRSNGCVSLDAQTTTVARRRLESGKSVCLIDASPDSVMLAMSVQSFDTDGLTLNYTTVDGSAYKIGYVAFAGFRNKVVAFQEPSSASTDTKVTSGFSSHAEVYFGGGNANVGVYESHFDVCVGGSHGVGSAPWETKGYGVSDLDSRSTSSTHSVSTVYEFIGAGATSHLVSGDVLTWDSDGFTVDWATVSGSNTWFTTLVFGGVIGEATVSASALLIKADQEQSITSGAALQAQDQTATVLSTAAVQDQNQEKSLSSGAALQAQGREATASSSAVLQDQDQEQSITSGAALQVQGIEKSIATSAYLESVDLEQSITSSAALQVQGLEQDIVSSALLAAASTVDLTLPASAALQARDQEQSITSGAALQVAGLGQSVSSSAALQVTNLEASLPSSAALQSQDRDLSVTSSALLAAPPGTTEAPIQSSAALQTPDRDLTLPASVALQTVDQEAPMASSGFLAARWNRGVVSSAFLQERDQEASLAVLGALQEQDQDATTPASAYLQVPRSDNLPSSARLVLRSDLSLTAGALVIRVGSMGLPVSAALLAPDHAATASAGGYLRSDGVEAPPLLSSTALQVRDREVSCASSALLERPGSLALPSSGTLAATRSTSVVSSALLAVHDAEEAIPSSARLVSVGSLSVASSAAVQDPNQEAYLPSSAYLFSSVWLGDVTLPSGGLLVIEGDTVLSASAKLVFSSDVSLSASARLALGIGEASLSCSAYLVAGSGSVAIQSGALLIHRLDLALPASARLVVRNDLSLGSSAVLQGQAEATLPASARLVIVRDASLSSSAYLSAGEFDLSLPASARLVHGREVQATSSGKLVFGRSVLTPCSAHLASTGKQTKDLSVASSALLVKTLSAKPRPTSRIRARYGPSGGDASGTNTRLKPPPGGWPKIPR